MTWAGETQARFAGHRVFALAIVLSVFLFPSAWADYKESYRKGIESVDHKEWSQVVRWMRSAVGEQPQEGGQIKIYGMRLETYLPHYYLGLALSKIGDCEGALAAWKESERQSVVQGTPHNKTLAQGRDTCRQRLSVKTPSAPSPLPGAPSPAEFAHELQNAEYEVRKATEAQNQVARRRNDPDIAEAWKQEGAQEKEVETTGVLDKARSELERGKEQKQLSDLQEAGRKAARARQDFEALAGRLDRRQGEILQTLKATEAREKLAWETRDKERQREQAAEAARVASRSVQAEQERAEHQQAVQQIGRAAGDAKKVLGRVATTKPRDAELQRREAVLRDLLHQAEKVTGGTPLAEIHRLHSGLSIATTRLDESLINAQGDSGPPAALRAAARAFFRKDYDGVIRSLGTATFTERRAAATGNLLLAAARYALYLQGGEKDVKLRQQASQGIADCKKSNSKISPGYDAFSPRFIEFFKSTG